MATMLAKEMLKVGTSAGGGSPPQTFLGGQGLVGEDGGGGEVGKVVIVTKLDGDRASVVPVFNLFRSAKP
jgi:hypothetical protein